MMESLPDMRARDREGLARIFRYFGEIETPRLDSRVYTVYSLGVAGDTELLDLASQIDPGQPPPNVLYAAVQDLLFEDSAGSPEAEALTPFYPAISGHAIPDRSPWEAFRRFCLSHADRLGPRLRAGKTQTCVVHRCAVVLPALASLPSIAAAGGRVALLEIGPSAGLNLRLDCYRYDYGGGVVWGDERARPELFCEARGTWKPPVPGALEVVARCGVDLNPIDPADAKAIRWLRALIWPEHVERARVMNEAFELAKSVPVEIDEGDATREIEAQIARLPEDAPRVLFATHVVYQIPREGRRAMYAGIERASLERPVDLLVMESTGQGDSRIEWTHFESGARSERTTLARSDPHGRWIEWGAR
jgi:hypothetical protein